MSTDTEILAEVRKIHQIESHYRCGARTTEVVTHQFSGQTKKSNLVCTEAPGHEGPHKDSVCCWSFHQFEAPTPDAPEDIYAGRFYCTCGAANCATLRALEGEK